MQADLAALKRVIARRAGEPLQLIWHLRNRSGLGQTRFDDAVREGIATHQLTAHHHDFPHQYPDDEWPQRFVRVGQAYYHALALPEKGTQRESSLEADAYAKVQKAYDRVSARQKSPWISLSDLHNELGSPSETPFKIYMLKLCKEHKAIPMLGEPTRASKQQLKYALEIGGRPHIYINLRPNRDLT